MEAGKNEIWGNKTRAYQFQISGLSILEFSQSSTFSIFEFLSLSVLFIIRMRG